MPFFWKITLVGRRCWRRRAFLWLERVRGFQFHGFRLLFCLHLTFLFRFRFGLRCPTDFGHFGCWWIEPFAQPQIFSKCRTSRAPKCFYSNAGHHNHSEPARLSTGGEVARPNVFFSCLWHAEPYVFSFHVLLVALLLSRKYSQVIYWSCRRPVKANSFCYNSTPGTVRLLEAGESQMRLRWIFAESKNRGTSLYIRCTLGVPQTRIGMNYANASAQCPDHTVADLKFLFDWITSQVGFSIVLLPKREFWKKIPFFHVPWQPHEGACQISAYQFPGVHRWNKLRLQTFFPLHNKSMWMWIHIFIRCPFLTLYWRKSLTHTHTRI